jgi:hypothetical protein
MALLKKLSKYEIISMVKQLGMMHVLYFMNKQLYNVMNNIYTPKMYSTLEDFILSHLSTEQKLIDNLDAWEKRYWYHNAKKKLNN